MMYQQVGEDLAEFASKTGAPTNPDWYYNLLANPKTTVEVGTDTVAVEAEEVTGQVREGIWEKQKSDYPGFAEYEAATTRTIPVILLHPTG